MTKKWLLALIGVTAVVATNIHASDPVFTVTERGHNAAREYGEKYFLSYREQYGADMRMAIMLEVCGQTQLFKQLQSELPKTGDYVGQKFKEDKVWRDHDASELNMVLYLAVFRAEGFVFGYQFGYREAIKGEFESSKACAVVPKLYEDYLKRKTKTRQTVR